MQVVRRYLKSFILILNALERTMDPLNLFRVDGMVAVVTGGGTGMFSISLSLHAIILVLMFGFTPSFALRLHLIATSYEPR
jgi:hypothetical protein